GQLDAAARLVEHGDALQIDDGPEITTAESRIQVAVQELDRDDDPGRGMLEQILQTSRSAAQILPGVCVENGHDPAIPTRRKRVAQLEGAVAVQRINPLRRIGGRADEPRGLGVSIPGAPALEILKPVE